MNHRQSVYVYRMELTIGEQLAMARKRSGLSQETVGSMARLSANTIGKIERGIVSPTARQLRAISVAVGATLTMEIS